MDTRTLNRGTTKKQRYRCNSNGHHSISENKYQASVNNPHERSNKLLEYGHQLRYWHMKRLYFVKIDIPEEMSNTLQEKEKIKDNAVNILRVEKKHMEASKALNKIQEKSQEWRENRLEEKVKAT